MIFISEEIKNDPVKRWNLPDATFFGAGACHILAFAFLEKYDDYGFHPVWIKPDPGCRGNHIFVTDGNLVFDYAGISSYDSFISSIRAYLAPVKFELIELTKEVLVSEAKSKEYEGLWLREPGQFLHDALPRARKYLEQFDLPEYIKCGAEK